MIGAAPERLCIEGPSGALEAVIEDPLIAAPYYAVICHPHPLFGGTLDNKVVTSVARALRDAGMPTVRFNFRGVGGSAGVFDAGIGETADAESVIGWAGRRWPDRTAVVAGFSFGAFVALAIAQRYPPARLIMIAPPVERFNFTALEAPDCPWLVIQGDADDVVAPDAVIAWTKVQTPPPQLVVMAGAGHFFHGRLLDLRQVVGGFLSGSVR